MPQTKTAASDESLAYDIVVIESKLYQVKNGEYFQINLETTANLVMDEDGKSVADILAEQTEKQASLQTAVAGNNETVTSLGTRIGSCEEKNQANETALSELTEKVTAAEGKIEKNAEAITALQTACAKITDLEERLAALEQTSEEPGTEAGGGNETDENGGEE